MSVEEFFDKFTAERDYCATGLLEVLEELVAAGYTIAKLNHVGWQSQDDHSLEPLDTDEDYQPPDTLPVFVLGSDGVGIPELED